MPTVIEELRRDPARTNSAIAALCGVTRDTVRLIRKRHGVDPLPRGKPRQPARVAVRLTREEWHAVLCGLARWQREHEALAARIEAQL